jgi:hypothetical protein
MEKNRYTESYLLKDLREDYSKYYSQFMYSTDFETGDAAFNLLDKLIYYCGTLEKRIEELEQWKRP